MRNKRGGCHRCRSTSAPYVARQEFEVGSRVSCKATFDHAYRECRTWADKGRGPSWRSCPCCVLTGVFPP